jgi:hypothetical protein
MHWQLDAQKLPFLTFRFIVNLDLTLSSLSAFGDEFVFGLNTVVIRIGLAIRPV